MANEANDKKTVELDWNMDPIERIAEESKALPKNDFMGLAIAAYLAAEMKKDQNLLEAYSNRKVTLKSILESVMATASKKLGGNNGQIPDQEVYGWAVHYVMDGNIPSENTKSESLKITLTKEDRVAAKEAAVKELQKEELEKLRKKEAAKIKRQQQKLEEEERRRRESGQMSLFDFMEQPGDDRA